MDEKTRKRVNEAWDKIESLVEKLDAKQLKHLNPPATQKQINELSNAIGINLPVDVQASLLRHNGCLPEETFLTFPFFSAETIAIKTIEQRRWYKKHCDENETQYSLDEGGWNDQTIMMGWSPAGFGFAVECETCEKAVPYFYDTCNYSMKLTRDYVSYLEALVDLLEKRSFDDPINDSKQIFIHGWGEHTGFMD